MSKCRFQIYKVSASVCESTFTSLWNSVSSVEDRVYFAPTLLLSTLLILSSLWFFPLQSQQLFTHLSVCLSIDFHSAFENIDFFFFFQHCNPKSFRLTPHRSVLRRHKHKYILMKSKYKISIFVAEYFLFWSVINFTHKKKNNNHVPMTTSQDFQVKHNPLNLWVSFCS